MTRKPPIFLILRGADPDHMCARRFAGLEGCNSRASWAGNKCARLDRVPASAAEKLLAQRVQGAWASTGVSSPPVAKFIAAGINQSLRPKLQSLRGVRALIAHQGVSCTLVSTLRPWLQGHPPHSWAGLGAWLKAWLIGVPWTTKMTSMTLTRPWRPSMAVRAGRLEDLRQFSHRPRPELLSVSGAQLHTLRNARRMPPSLSQSSRSTTRTCLQELELRLSQVAAALLPLGSKEF